MLAGRNCLAVVEREKQCAPFRTGVRIGEAPQLAEVIGQAIHQRALPVAPEHANHFAAKPSRDIATTQRRQEKQHVAGAARVQGRDTPLDELTGNGRVDGLNDLDDLAQAGPPGSDVDQRRVRRGRGGGLRGWGRQGPGPGYFNGDGRTDLRARPDIEDERARGGLQHGAAVGAVPNHHARSIG